ncbi:glycosyltransferase [Flavobacterium sp. LS1R47]|uniref:Glycosyltransferase n=1 Tax=Flavobacterium frigoritolerans TaxID=2987686 RepID=A0A9X2YY60_9FLAO|nr:glycosyltransferase family 2 protein [Flavobacterium frigoritolerans]MCV9931278.1 glycosyltransferase [Flavobacterium frigoritolerans]
MNMPLISIITVCRNSEDSIEATMMSVVSQRYHNIEYIIIDGLSTDNTFAIANGYQEKFKEKEIKFVCVSEKDKGIYDAMNKGIFKANGDWLIFMNSGDNFYDDLVLKNVFSQTFDNNEMVIYGDTLTKNAKTTIKPPKKIQKEFFFAETICHQSVFFKKEAFQIVGIFNLNYKIIADRIWLLKATILKVKFNYTPVIFSIWDEEGFSKENIPTYIKENDTLKRIYFSGFERFLFAWKFRICRVFTFFKHKT